MRGDCRKFILASSTIAFLTCLAGADPTLSPPEWSKQVWTAGRQDGGNTLTDLLAKTPTEFGDFTGATAKSLADALAKREVDRIKRIDEVNKELDAAIAGDSTDLSISKSFKYALELQMLATNKAGFMREERIQNVIAKGDAAARAAEARGDWLMSSELFARLDALMDDHGAYHKDAERQGRRLGMLRMYVPERLWELRNDRAKLEKAEGLPPYNSAADDWNQKLAKVDRMMILRAVVQAGDRHVERPRLNELITGGLDALRTMANTPDLKPAFSGLADESKRRNFVQAIDSIENELKLAKRDLNHPLFADLLDRVQAANSTTVGIPESAWLHEFGNGALGPLDEFSVIIWPDEVGRFQRQTQGSFVGVGVSIEFDELSQVRISTPLEGMPAHKAGVRAGDVIKLVNGKPLYGIGSLDQAVEMITGPINTKVTLTLEREGKDPSDAKETVPMTLTRSKIKVRTVRGWKRIGDGMSGTAADWDWMIDPTNRIGYIRLSQFADDSSNEMYAAVRAMNKDNSLKGIILDMRYNPGGFLDKAVEIGRLFVADGPIVGMKSSTGQVTFEDHGNAGGRAPLSDIPVAVLVNEGSASASEIVSGALGCYGSTGQIKTVIVGQRSYGKGSVQNVWPLMGGDAQMKVTTNYYTLPDSRVIHRKPGAANWGVEPTIHVEMTPAQITESLNARKNADMLPEEATGKKPSDPAEILTKGLDIQLQTALVILQSQTSHSTTAQGPGKSKNEAVR